MVVNCDAGRAGEDEEDAAAANVVTFRGVVGVEGGREGSIEGVEGGNPGGKEGVSGVGGKGL